MSQPAHSLEDRVRELFAALLQVDPAEIGDDTTPDRVAGWDSMQHLMLVSGFEEEFGVDVDPEEAVDMFNDFGTFKRVVVQKMAPKQ
jgi:acyl carrier protein